LCTFVNAALKWLTAAGHGGGVTRGTAENTELKKKKKKKRKKKKISRGQNSMLTVATTHTTQPPLQMYNQRGERPASSETGGLPGI